MERSPCPAPCIAFAESEATRAEARRARRLPSPARAERGAEALASCWAGTDGMERPYASPSSDLSTKFKEGDNVSFAEAEEAVPG